MKSVIAALRNLVLPYGRTSGKRLVLDGDNGRIQVYDASSRLVAEISPDASVVKVYGADGSWAALDPSAPSYAADTPGPGLLLSRPSGDGDPAAITEYDDTFFHGMYIRSPSPVAGGAEGDDYSSIRMDGRYTGGPPSIQLVASGGVGLNGANVDVNGQFTGYGVRTDFTPSVTGTGGAAFSTRTGWYYQLGPIKFVNVYLVVDATFPGSGTTPINVTLPFNVDRTTRQVLTMHTEGVGPNGSHIGNGSCLFFTSGAGGVADRLRTSSNDGTNRDQNITGADLLGNGIISMSGLLLEAI